MAPVAPVAPPPEGRFDSLEPSPTKYEAKTDERKIASFPTFRVLALMLAAATTESISVRTSEPFCCKVKSGTVCGENIAVGNVLNKAAVGTDTSPLASPVYDPPPKTRIPVDELISIEYCGVEIPPIASLLFNKSNTYAALLG